MRATVRRRLSLSDYAAVLADKFPVGMAVDVRLVDMPRDRDSFPAIPHFGDATKLATKYVIRIHKRLPVYVQKDVLDHEWAHIRVGWGKAEHGSKWGTEYARIVDRVSRYPLRKVDETEAR